MQTLSINDKSAILGINNIEDKYITGDNRKIIIFEYFAKFEESFLFQKVNTLGFNFQVKIKKELYGKCEESLLNSQYIDINALDEKNNGKYSIILEEDKERELETTNIPKEQLKEFIIEEKGEKYIYRHYIIIEIPDDQNIENITYEFISQIRDNNSIIRLLKQEGLQEYLKSELFSKKVEGYEIQKGNSDFKIHEIITNPGKLSYLIINKIKKIIDTIENSFFQQNIENIDPYIVDILSTSTYKADNYIKNGDLYKGGLYLKGIPKQDFNILKFLFNYLEEGDSITINMYPEEKHKIKEKELKGVDKYLNKTEEKKSEDIYLQLIINLSDINNVLLDKKIENFQLVIGEDFYTQRITGVMSSYFATYIGTGDNKLNLERLYNREKLIQNLLF